MNYLNLGCGSHFHPNWTNVDFVSTGEGVIAHNLRQRLPFSQNSFDAVYHSHVLEHLPKSEAESFLQECYRVLRPGGVIRVAVPDLEQIARLYLTALEHISQGDRQWNTNYDWLMLELYDQVVRTRPGGDMAAYLAQPALPNEAFVIQRLGKEAENLIQMLRQYPIHSNHSLEALSEREATLKHLLGDEDYAALQIGRFRQAGEVHQWMYDRHSLSQLMAQSGFEQVRVCRADESTIPDFGQYYLDVEPDGRVRKPDSLFVEAIKPTQVSNLENSVEATLDQAIAPPFPQEPVAPPLTIQELPQFQTLQTQVQQLQDAVHQMQHKLQQSKTVLQETRRELEQSQSIINAMESSKFWKLRSLWFKLKEKVGLADKSSY